jgi:hypothetical protein
VEKDSVVLAWDQNPDAASYGIDLGQSFGDRGSPSCDGSACEVRISHLAAGVDYTFGVRATDAAGNQGPASQVHAVPGSSGSLSAPSVVLLAADDGMLHLRFTHPASEGAARFHVWYRALGGSEQDAGFLVWSQHAWPTFCENYSPLHCDTWLTGLSDGVSYAVSVQAEGAPGNLGPRSSELVVAPGSAAPGKIEWPDMCEWDIDSVTVRAEPSNDIAWSYIRYFAPDLVALRVTLHAQFLVLSGGAWTGQYSYQDYVSDFPASSACNADLSRCRGTISVPEHAQYSSTVSVQMIDRTGNVGQAIGGAQILNGANKRCLY